MSSPENRTPAGYLMPMLIPENKPIGSNIQTKKVVLMYFRTVCIATMKKQAMNLKKEKVGAYANV